MRRLLFLLMGLIFIALSSNASATMQFQVFASGEEEEVGISILGNNNIEASSGTKTALCNSYTTTNGFSPTWGQFYTDDAINFKLAIYNDDGEGGVGALVENGCSTQNAGDGIAYKWVPVTFSTPPSLDSDTPYWLCFEAAAAIGYKYTAGSSETSDTALNCAAWDGAPGAARKVSMYVTDE